MFYSYLYREDGTVERLGIKIYETSINPRSEKYLQVTLIVSQVLS